MIRIYRYSEGEHSFMMIDGRDVDIPRFRKPREVHSLCLLHGVDGLAIVNKSELADFKLEFFPFRNPSQLSLCAAACSVAFADLLGVKPFHSQDYRVEFDGTVLDAQILSHLGECKQVRLQSREFSSLCEGEIE